MDEFIHPRLRQLVSELGQAVRQGTSCSETTSAVKEALRSSILEGGWLPESCSIPSPDCYARHLVHWEPDDHFSIVAMVWNVGQKTPVHDHSGVWCVEGVYAGRIDVIRYDLLEKTADGLARFRRHDKLDQGVGATGALIPPSEYHVIENTGAVPAITVHVYGCDMKSCGIFVPREDGLYEPCQKSLKYTSVWNKLSPAVPAR